MPPFFLYNHDASFPARTSAPPPPTPKHGDPFQRRRWVLLDARKMCCARGLSCYRVLRPCLVPKYPPHARLPFPNPVQPGATNGSRTVRAPLTAIPTTDIPLPQPQPLPPTPTRARALFSSGSESTIESSRGRAPEKVDESESFSPPRKSLPSNNFPDISPGKTEPTTKLGDNGNWVHVNRTPNQVHHSRRQKAGKFQYTRSSIPENLMS